SWSARHFFMTCRRCGIRRYRPRYLEAMRLEAHRLWRIDGDLAPCFARFAKCRKILRRIGQFEVRRIDRLSAGSVRMHRSVEDAADKQSPLDGIRRFSGPEKG